MERSPLRRRICRVSAFENDAHFNPTFSGLPSFWPGIRSILGDLVTKLAPLAALADRKSYPPPQPLSRGFRHASPQTFIHFGRTELPGSSLACSIFNHGVLWRTLYFLTIRIWAGLFAASSLGLLAELAEIHH